MSIPFFIKDQNELNYIIKNHSEVLNRKTLKYKIELNSSQYYLK